MSSVSQQIKRFGQTFEIFRQDCIKGMAQKIKPNSVDVITTSPPYNLGINYSSYDDNLSREDYLDWLDQWANIAKSILKDDGSLFLNIGAKPSEPTIPFQVIGVMQKYFKVQNVIHWIKSVAIQKDSVGSDSGIKQNTSVGHFKPINSPRFLNDCQEYIFHLTKDGNVKLDRLAVGVEYQHKSNINRWKHNGKDQRCRGNTWFIPYKTINNRDKQRPHPATFPIKVPEMCIRLHGLEKVQLVVDPFLGIGTTALACLELGGINFKGFEIDKSYFSESHSLISSYIPQNAMTQNEPLVIAPTKSVEKRKLLV